MKLSHNFTLKEFTRSNTAKRFNIKNEPTEIEIARMKVLCKSILQPARNHFVTKYGEAFIKITSGFRNVELNTKLGGSPTSFHTFGFAADCELYVKKGDEFVESNEELFNYIKECLPFTELIDEYDFSWVHVAYDPQDSRRMIKKIG